MRKLLFVFGAILLVTLTGCTTRLIDFTVLSSKNIEWNRAAEYKRATARVNGEDKAHIIIFIPTGTPNLKEALDRAIEAVPGAVALLDGVVTSKLFYIPYIYGQSSYIVEGTPLIDPALESRWSFGNYAVTTYCRKTNKWETKAISENQYEQLMRTAHLESRLQKR